MRVKSSTVDRGFSFTVDLEPGLDGAYSVSESRTEAVQYGEAACRRSVNSLMASMGVTRRVGYQTFWRWRKFMDWPNPPYEDRQVMALAVFGRLVARESDGGVGLPLKTALPLAMEKVFGDKDNG